MDSKIKALWGLTACKIDAIWRRIWRSEGSLRYKKVPTLVLTLIIGRASCRHAKRRIDFLVVEKDVVGFHSSERAILGSAGGDYPSVCVVIWSPIRRNLDPWQFGKRQSPEP